MIEKEPYFNGIPASEYVIDPGDWDIHYRDKSTSNTRIMRYVVIRRTPLSEFDIDNLEIIKIVQQR